MRIRKPFAVLALLLPAALAQAQTDVEVNGQIQFNFSNPGARSLALGGAFIALADDATAAFTNPAGLTTLVRPELSAEGRLWRFEHSFTNGGRLPGNRPSGIGIDTVEGFLTARSSDHAAGPSFASFVYPRGRFAVAAYRQQAAKFRAHVETHGAFLSNQTSNRLLPTISALTLDVANHGLSAAYRITDTLALGAGVSYYRFALDSSTSRYAFPSLATGAAGNYWGPPEFAERNVQNRQFQTGKGDRFGWNAGLQWKAGRKLDLGAVIQRAPSFEFRVENQFGPFPSPPHDGELLLSKTATFDIPDIVGAGAALRPSNALTLLLDYRRVSYADLVRRMVLIFPESPAKPADFKLENANELHLGVEYVLGRTKTPVALRAGVWRDPDHRMYYSGAISDPDTEAKSATFRRGSDQWHGAGGVGVVLQRFQIDAALELSSLATTASVAMVLRF